MHLKCRLLSKPSPLCSLLKVIILKEGHMKIRIRLIKCCVLEVQTGERLRQEWANVGHTKGQVAGTWGSLGRG